VLWGFFDNNLLVREDFSVEIHPPVAFLGVRAQSATGGVFVSLN
jgi:hypothetical protein